MTTYVLTISLRFPKTHSKSGQETNFWSAIQKRIKKHTIRGNYKLWEKRFKKIEKGEACLSVRQWSGVPYQSKQIELIRLDKSHRIGIEKLINPNNFAIAQIEFEPTKTKVFNWEDIAKNDGLSFPDFCEWFKKATSEPMAIIHFSDFRYNRRGN